MKATAALLAFLLFSLCANANAQENQARLAKVDYMAIRELLQQVVLAQPENQELAQRYREYEAMMEDVKHKQTSQPPKEWSPPRVFVANEAAGEVNLRCEALLKSLIEKNYGERYEAVLRAGDTSWLVLYTKASIDDITEGIRGELMKLLPTPKP